MRVKNVEGIKPNFRPFGWSRNGVQNIIKKVEFQPLGRYRLQLVEAHTQ
jgi:hypothetical protein